ncbi:helix-turn-helix domain-containing protein [Pseudomonas typographi]|uniref:Helix-turn-helix transcriptional regulator n=1 Tax=Pseudomonas typographi TaxID=2715964 RepID=A0ABR7Z0N4_9PSED|nr:helix-turn-helix transcriptional regulator [Pseudomonas typographi]MBD1551353.1 helix-turn-helix transcriptional regulator [Pseudomonas typographi]MBD1588765.1 helix-turn-helix transcriptional regulator [Pseudomonas typographi]MBD1598881.1 helix-turn-helix transcriptional regulator [Pseudomonas typographi]
MGQHGESFHACAIFEDLTTRERQVLFWCCHGKTASEIAMLLHCATSTVNFHINNLHAKFGIASTTYIVAIMASEGLVLIEPPFHLAKDHEHIDHDDLHFTGRRPPGDVGRNNSSFE